MDQKIFKLFAFSLVVFSFIYSKEEVNNLDNIVPVAIIGSGPAGLTAGMYSTRSGYYTVVFDGPLPGGQLTKAAWIENWPGLDKTDGKTAIEKLKKQAQKFGTKIVNKTIKSVDFSKCPFKLYTDSGDIINALSVIIASGATPRKLGVQGEDKYWGKGIQDCAICDAPLFKDKTVLVVGGGDASIEQVLLLKPYAKKIIFLVRGNNMRASDYMQKKLKSTPQVEIIYNAEVLKFEGDNSFVNKVILLDKKNKKKRNIKIDGAFIAIGQEPNTKFLGNQLDLNKNGCIKVNCKNQKTSVTGIFAAGNACDGIYRQANVACSLGCKAALKAKDYLNAKNINMNNLKNKFYLYNSDNFKEEPKEKQEKDMENNQDIYTFQEFNDYIESNRASKPVLVFLYSPTCPHCHQMMPIVDEELKNNSKVNLLKVNISESEPEIAQKFNIRGVPTFVVIKDAEPVGQFAGSMSKEDFEKQLNSYLN